MIEGEGTHAAVRTPECRSGSLMRNLENWTFTVKPLGSNKFFKNLGCIWHQECGKRCKICPNLFELCYQASKTAARFKFPSVFPATRDVEILGGDRARGEKFTFVALPRN